MISVLLLATGCQEQQQQQTRPKAPIEGLKLSDIQPAHRPEQPDEMSIQVFTFEVPEKNSQYITEIFEDLSKHYVKFPNLDVFEKNGFQAGFGLHKSWPIFSNSIYRASAKTVLTNNLLFMNSSLSDVVTGSSYDGQSFYLERRRDDPELVKLRGGRLLWRVSARAMPDREGIGLVQIKALHKEEVLSAITKVPGYEQSGETLFNDISIKLNMAPGEFVVIGPAIEQGDRITLGDLYFKRQGDIATPISKDKDNTETIHTTVTVEKNVPLLRLYAFVCTGVSN